MRRLTAILLSAFTALLLSGANPTLTPTASALPSGSFPFSCPAEVPATGVPGVVRFATNTRQEYLRDDFRLAPLFLPISGRIGHLLWGYDRLGYLFHHMTPNDFLECYWQPTFLDPNNNSPTGQEGWKFPPDDGFAPGTRRPVTVTQGRLQLFGFAGGNGVPGGKFLAPEGTSYRETAIPPSNLSTLDALYPFNYHLFLVCKPFTAETGIVAPWFQQPGGGTQYFTGNSVPNNVGGLLDGKFLQDITLSPNTTTCSP